MASVPLGAPTAGSAAWREVLIRRVRVLVAAAITYNVVEAVVAVSAGAVSSSSALAASAWTQ